jgi:hypothetical protein
MKGSEDSLTAMEDCQLQRKDREDDEWNEWLQQKGKTIVQEKHSFHPFLESKGD